MKEVGDRAVIHGPRGRTSDRKLSEDARSNANRGVGPTIASRWLRITTDHKLRLAADSNSILTWLMCFFPRHQKSLSLVC